MMNILSFDIEDWYCHDDYSQDFNWQKHEVRVYEYTDLILDELEHNNIKATFFCLGWLAEFHPSLIRKIADKGHHVGCHSYQHQLATRFTRKEFYNDTIKSKKLLEDTIGKEVDAYRVPSFSITNSNNWAFDVLIELGFKYDCSIFPTNHEFGGYENYPAVNTPSIIKTSYGTIKEFPVSTISVFNKNIVYSGGGYFKIIPFYIIKKMMDNSKYNMVYLHPSNFDSKQPQMRHLPLTRQLKNRIGLSWTLPKFQKLLNRYPFYSLLEADKCTDWYSMPIIEI